MSKFDSELTFALLSALNRLATAAELIAERLGTTRRPAPKQPQPEAVPPLPPPRRAIDDWVSPDRITVIRAMIAAGNRTERVISAINSMQGLPVTAAVLASYNRRHGIVRPMSTAQAAHLERIQKLNPYTNPKLRAVAAQTVPAPIVVPVPKPPHGLPALPSERTANPSRLSAAFGGRQ
jgi:hypothetical protein